MNYLNDFSTLDAIQKKYAALPQAKVWSMADVKQAPVYGTDAKGNQIMISPGSMQIDPTTGKMVEGGIDKPVALPGQDSPRFGKGAYANPFEKWIDIDKLGSFTDDFDITRDATTGKYTIQYKRTGRDLGTLPTMNRTYNTGGGDTWTSPDRIAPQNADFLFDMADELGRIDPNIIKRDLTTLPGYNQRKSFVPPTTLKAENPLIPTITPPGTQPKSGDDPFAAFLKK